MEIIYDRPPLTKYQRAILNSTARFTITEASTKSGKTASHIIWLFEEALKCSSNQTVWWVAPVYQQTEIAYNRMITQVSHKDFFKKNETKLRLTLPNGAIVQFKSGEKPDNLYGDDVYACVVDEASRLRVESWYAIRSTLTATNGKCKLIGNVKGKKNWFYNLGIKARSGEKDYEYFKITSYDAVDSGVLSLDEVEQAKRDLPEHVFKELYLAEPNEDASNPFGIKHIKDCLRPISNNPTAVFGIDLAKSHDHTVITGLDSYGNVSYYSRFQSDWAITKQEIIHTIKKTPALIDSTGVGDAIVEDIQRQCPNAEGYVFTSGSKQKLMEALSSAVQNRQVSILENEMKEEMESFEYVYSSRGVTYTAPVGLHDDCVCSLALANYKLRFGINNDKVTLLWA